MKYMGSKRAMLTNGLGKILDHELKGRRRFVDLFCGSATVVWHVAQLYRVKTLAFDLQNFSVILAQAVLSRNSRSNLSKTWETWLSSATNYTEAHLIPSFECLSLETVEAARHFSSTFPEGSLVYAYGGHYYSPQQALWIQAFRETLPENSTDKNVLLAALLMAASKAAASPGHTAQPFQPTPAAIPYLNKSWTYNISDLVHVALNDLESVHAQICGFANVGDANEVTNVIESGDLVFVDPPYSCVQYSRFYHVLESISLGEAITVSGAGRYPPQSQRPKSSYSLKTESKQVFHDLIKKLAIRDATVVLTFPDHLCSNGLSGETIRQISAEYFSIDERSVNSVFSTMGGGALEKPGSRMARQHAQELILCLRPR